MAFSSLSFRFGLFSSGLCASGLFASGVHLLRYLLGERDLLPLHACLSRPPDTSLHPRSVIHKTLSVATAGLSTKANYIARREARVDRLAVASASQVES